MLSSAKHEQHVHVKRLTLCSYFYVICESRDYKNLYVSTEFGVAAVEFFRNSKINETAEALATHSQPQAMWREIVS